MSELIWKKCPVFFERSEKFMTDKIVLADARTITYRELGWNHGSNYRPFSKYERGFFI